MDVGERLQHIIEAKGMSQKEFADRVGMTRSKVNKILTGSQKISADELVTFVDVLGMTSDDILGIASFRQIEEKDVVRIPIVGSIKAGNGGYIHDEMEGYSTYLNVELKKNAEYVVLRVKGDSMTGDNIYEGDLALIEKDAEYEKNKIYAVIVNGFEAKLKRLVKEDDRIILFSSNAEYEPSVITGDEMNDVIIVGRMVKLQRDF